ncbi:amylo-alpha-1,6-glucosidase [Nonlabens sp.]|uniref:amylo-alpha-1,6-glucosidase n=1 Tax=Nonlabens sp. TaxID=1888209 RepID=UPI0025DB1DEE|nr:amylo-alpha-1,6-glucosidase [Nonlabens sp.]
MSYIKITSSQISNLDYSLKREVLQTNNVGSYCYSTIIGTNTRKYHGLLAVPQPHIDLDQHVLLSTITEEITEDQHHYELGTQKYPNTYAPHSCHYISTIEVEPVHKVTYAIGHVILTKELVLVPYKNQILIRYTLIDSKSAVQLKLNPFLAFKNKHCLNKANSTWNTRNIKVPSGVCFHPYELYDKLFLQFSSNKSTFVEESDWYYNAEYEREKERGYDYHEDLWKPGYFLADLRKGESLVFSAGLKEVNPKGLKSSFTKAVQKLPLFKTMEDCLIHAASQFIIQRDRQTEVIAGYPWFNRWGRDTFIALPGLTLSQGNVKDFKAVLDGMIQELNGPLFPNLGTGKQAARNAVDTPLWLFWTLQQYVQHTATPSKLWKKYGVYMKSILNGYKEGTQYNIQMQDNALIYAGEEGVALTWMDAVCENKVVTPRMGYAVEINALWYNAVCFSVASARLSGDEDFVSNWEPYINKIKTAFLETFWDQEKGYLADVAKDGFVDWSIRPNQVIATSLAFTPLNEKQCRAVLLVVENKLLTPRGLRSLSPDDPNYIGSYQGSQQSRDSAYHQGTVWPWLLGHYAEGYLKIHQNKGVGWIQSLYNDFENTLQEHGLGTVSEVYDGDPPHHPRGAISQAWSVAELLRIHQMLHKYYKIK